MAWNDEPPKDYELESNDWTKEPPTDAELNSKPLTAGLEGFGQGATFGYLNELQAATEPAMFGLANLLTGQDVKSEGDYDQRRAEYENRRKQLAEENPKSMMAGNVAGALATGIASSPLTAAKGATALARVGQQAAIGGAQGFLQDTDSQGLDGVERLKNAGFGVLTGGVAQGLGEGIPLAKAALSRGAKRGAENMAARALGAERGTIKKLGADKVKAIGRQALDEGVITPFSGVDDLIEKNLAVKSAGGSKMGEVYDAIDEAGASKFNPLESAAEIDEKIGGFYRSPINKAETNQLENTLESVLVRGDKPISIKEAQKLKEELGKVANWKNNLNITDKERMARDAYGVISKNIDDAVDAGANSLNKGDLLETLQAGKKQFGLASGAEELLTNKKAREEGNKILGLTDWSLLGGGGAATAVTGGAAAIPTVAALATKKFAEKYGANISALTLDKVSKALMKDPKWLKIATDNPNVFVQYAVNMSARMDDNKAGPQEVPQAKAGEPFKNKEEILQKSEGSKYAQVLQNAAQKGDQSLAAAHFVLNSRDQAYRELMSGKGK